METKSTDRVAAIAAEAQTKVIGAQKRVIEQLRQRMRTNTFIVNMMILLIAIMVVFIVYLLAKETFGI